MDEKQYTTNEIEQWTFRICHALGVIGFFATAIAGKVFTGGVDFVISLSVGGLVWAVTYAGMHTVIAPPVIVRPVIHRYVYFTDPVESDDSDDLPEEDEAEIVQFDEISDPLAILYAGVSPNRHVMIESTHWNGIYIYLKNPNAALSRRALDNMVPGRFYSKYADSDQYKTFPELMVEMGAARTSVLTNGGVGYEWTAEARKIIRELITQMKETAPLPEGAVHPPYQGGTDGTGGTELDLVEMAIRGAVTNDPPIGQPVRENKELQ